MAKKVMIPKQRDDYGYRPNKILWILFLVGYPLYVIYLLIGYFYNLYRIFFIVHTGDYLYSYSETTELVIMFTAIISMVIFFLSVPLVVYDAKKLRVGLAYEKERFFKSITWKARSWAWLMIFFWFYIFPLYLYRRKQIYMINKEAMVRLQIPDEPIEIVSRKDVIIIIILVIVMITSLAFAYYSSS